MSEQPPKKPARQLKLEIPGNLSATYANAAVINQTFSEIVIDFVQTLPNDPRARVQQRIVLTPSNAKLVLQALESNLKRYEDKHGEIKTPPKPLSLADQLFGNIRGDEEEDTEADEEDEADE
jgi:hypothetical protein